jgi:hypothetical protein
MAKKAPRDSADLGLVVLGLIAWVAAIMFGANQTTVDVEQIPGPGYNKSTVKAPNIASAGAACGFAIAGGLCFVGAVLASRSSRNESPAPDPAEIPDTKH